MEDKERNLYDDMVIQLSNFVIRTACKDNPTDSEVAAMAEIARLLFRTM